ncbi:MAG: hypothetical protein HY567_03135 [Candidatus Kerfeldbacteria bacterium]|nr:hypothetical protein [Candidatus Kerfeldbacteria bacterium]
MSQSADLIRWQQRVGQAVDAALVRNGHTGPISNWTTLGEHFEQIIIEVAKELDRLPGTDLDIGPNLTKAELVGMFS